MDVASRIRTAACAAFCALAISVEAQGSGSPLSIPFNMSIGGHGPDGPWNFITLKVGSGPASTVDFYPTFQVQESLLVGSGACGANSNGCINPQPGYYNLKAQSASSGSQRINTSVVTSADYNAGLLDQVGLNGTGQYWADSVDTSSLGNINGSNIAFYVSNNMSGSAGSVDYAPVSLLSLEPSTNNNRTKLVGGGNANVASLLQRYHESTGGSNVMTLHYGSAAFNQTGSLMFGGYDPSRLIEPPAIFSHLGFFPLNNISFGVASGKSPWEHTQNLPTNFLGDPLQVLFSPQTPNLRLPSQVCSYMAQFLPVTYDRDTDLYLWNTTSPSYRDIVTSPSYLSFGLGDAHNTSIKVPFALLNLNLTAPLKKTPTPYLPCSPTNGAFTLGRAFLQSAFLMQAYSPDFVYVGQAPGPMINQSTRSTPVTLAQANPDAQPMQNAPTWADTWSNVLKPLGTASTITPGPGSGSGSDNSTGGSNGGLSGGAIAGIVIGVLVALALIAGAAFFFLRKRRMAQTTPIAPAATEPAGPVDSVGATTTAAGVGQGVMKEKVGPAYSPAPATPGVLSQPPAYENHATEVPANVARHEIDTSHEYHEMPGSEFDLPTGGHYGQAFEMADTSTRPEMPGSSVPR